LLLYFYSTPNHFLSTMANSQPPAAGSRRLTDPSGKTAFSPRIQKHGYSGPPVHIEGRLHYTYTHRSSVPCESPPVFHDFSLVSPEDYDIHIKYLYRRIRYQVEICVGPIRTISVMQRELDGSAFNWTSVQLLLVPALYCLKYISSPDNSEYIIFALVSVKRNPVYRWFEGFLLKIVNSMGLSIALRLASMLELPWGPWAALPWVLRLQDHNPGHRMLRTWRWYRFTNTGEGWGWFLQKAA
jgi:hypothetical protein